MRDSVEGDDSAPYNAGDEPFDEEFGLPYFGLYGVTEDGCVEHIADYSTYKKAVRLAQKLAPGIGFPDTP